jgi:hypothetical protein
MPRLHVRGLGARTGQRQSCDVPRLTACTSTTSRQFKRCGARVFLSGRSLRTSRNPIRLSATMAPMSQIRDHDFATKSQVRLCGAEGNRTPDPRLAKAVLYQLSYSPKRGPAQRPPAERSVVGGRVRGTGLGRRAAVGGNGAERPVGGRSGLTPQISFRLRCLVALDHEKYATCDRGECQQLLHVKPLFLYGLARLAQPCYCTPAIQLSPGPACRRVPRGTSPQDPKVGSQVRMCPDA